MFLDRWHRWCPPADQLERLTEELIAVGTTWQASSVVSGQDMSVTVKVADYEPGVRFGLVVTGSIEAKETFHFARDAEGARLAMTLELADAQLVELARQQWENDLAALKRLLRARGDATGGNRRMIAFRLR